MVGMIGAIVSKLRTSMKNMILLACGRSFPMDKTFHDHHLLPPFHSSAINVADTSINDSSLSDAMSVISEELINGINSHPSTTKNLCPICLDPLTCGSSSGSGSGQAIYTAKCSHSFHFTCISSNVRHGSVNCPVCRSHWSQLPRNQYNPTDPILQILDDSIANVRFQRRSILRSAHYNDDDPIEPDHYPDPPRLLFTIISMGCLSVTLNHLPAIDLVLVASPNGPQMRLIKQCMALVICSLRRIDRVAIVTYSSTAARVFPLRLVTSYGKRTALQVIDRLFYSEQSDPIEGIRKGIKIIGDRAYKNPKCSILHLSNSPTRTYQSTDDDPVPIHRFHVGYGNGFVVNEFKEFLSRVVGGGITDVRLRIGVDGRIVEIGEMRSGDERIIPLKIEECRNVGVEYSYRVYNDVGEDECYRTGDVVVDGSCRMDGSNPFERYVGRSNGCESLGYYYDPYRTARWAKHLHDYRL